eukprot:1467997-Pyramimonas_sp.AAC.1
MAHPHPSQNCAGSPSRACTVPPTCRRCILDSGSMLSPEPVPPPIVAPQGGTGWSFSDATRRSNSDFAVDRNPA